MQLELQAAQVIGTEGRAKYNAYRQQHDGEIDDGFAITLYAPNINLVRVCLFKMCVEKRCWCCCCNLTLP